MDGIWVSMGKIMRDATQTHIHTHTQRERDGHYCLSCLIGWKRETVRRIRWCGTASLQWRCAEVLQFESHVFVPGTVLSHRLESETYWYEIPYEGRKHHIYAVGDTHTWHTHTQHTHMAHTQLPQCISGLWAIAAFRRAFPHLQTTQKGERRARFWRWSWHHLIHRLWTIPQGCFEEWQSRILCPNAILGCIAATAYQHQWSAQTGDACVQVYASVSAQL